MMFEILGSFVILLLLKVLLGNKSPSDPPILSNKLPLIGHLHLIFGSNAVGIWDTVKKVSIECYEKGGVISVYLGLRRIYNLFRHFLDPMKMANGIVRVITDPEDCLTVSNTCLNKDALYNFAKNFIGISVFTADAELWKIKRKLLNPAFNTKVLNSFINIFNDNARLLGCRFKMGEPFDMGEVLRLCSLETICMTAFGTDFQENKTIQKNYLDWQTDIMAILIERFLKFWLHLDWIYHFSSLKKREDEVVKNLHTLSNSIIQQKKKEMITEIQDDTKVKPFMDLILELANDTGCFTDDEVRGETDTIISGGHDTSGTTLTYAFILIGSYPAIQKKIYHEIIEVFGNGDRDVDKDDLVKLVYIDAVLKETLRLYSVAPFLGRRIDRDLKLRNCTLKAGSTCLLSFWGAHRHPIWGSDAEQFRPERWLNPDCLPTVNYFGGFSVGKRSCIGKGYAMMMMKTIIAHVVRRYKVTADVTKLEFKMDVTLKPVSGHYITLERRK